MRSTSIRFPLAVIITAVLVQPTDFVPSSVNLAGSRPANGCSVVIVLDVGWFMATIMAPFVWDGEMDGILVGTGGHRPPNEPNALYTQSLIEGIFRKLQAGETVRVATVGRRIAISPPLPIDPGEAAAATRRWLQVSVNDRYGPLPLWDAVDDATSVLASEPAPRAIVLVTAGMSTANHRSLSDVATRAAHSRTAVHIIHFSRPDTRAVRIEDKSSNPWIVLRKPFGDPPHVMLEQLAHTSGGSYVNGSDGPRKLGYVLEQVLERIRTARSSGPQPVKFVPNVTLR